MCGIVGTLVLKNDSFRIEESFVNGMRDTMFHRGPDGGGTWVSPDSLVGLGHRRLSIIDLSQEANQPMQTKNDSVVMVFNGEIYNHRDIREELENAGVSDWMTDHSDTEVIIKAYEKWGIDAIHKLRGMFAIAIWDKAAGKLWLVRDRIGIKPLYYSFHNGRLSFASEIKALLKDSAQERVVNEEALYHYLSFMTTPAPMTLFKGINKLPPGTWMCIDQKTGAVEEKKYWDIWENTKPYGKNEEERVVDEIRQELRTCVELRKESDVPVGVFLSGGIDSSTNTALFSEGENAKVKTFSIGYKGEFDSYTNETHFARQMADIAGAEYYEKLLTLDDLLDFLPEMIHLQDEPIADPVCVPVYYVSKLARENGVIVCQVGEGSDELFWGYPLWKTKWKLQKWANIPVPKFIKKSLLGVLNAAGKNNSPQFEALRRDVLGQPVFWGGTDYFSDKQKMDILSPRLKEKFKSFTSWEAIKPIYERYSSKAWEKSTVNWMSYIDLNLRLPELLLMRVDKMSMGVSLEGRVPFLDHEFVAKAMSIPESIKTKDGVLKYVLKKAVRGIIPDELIDRKKQGFGVPVQEFLLDELGPRVRQDLQDFMDETDFLDKKGVDKLLGENDPSRVWILFNFVLWWKHYIKQPEAEKVSHV